MASSFLPASRSSRESIGFTLFWILLSTLFGIGVWHFSGAEAGLQFATGYVLEKALSVDNLFVMLVVMRAFAVPGPQQHRVLFWGVLGALVMRGIFIFAGVALISRFHWLLLIFGAFLIFTGIKLALQKTEDVHPENNVFVKLLKKWLPVSTEPNASTFTVMEHGRRAITPLLLALVTVEVTDLIFAVDSIPAVFAVSHDPFIVLTSNIFAVMGLRSLFFVLADLMERFVFLKFGLAAVLVFVGGKMLAEPWFKVPIALSLLVILAMLALSVVLSLVRNRMRESALHT